MKNSNFQRRISQKQKCLVVLLIALGTVGCDQLTKLAGNFKKTGEAKAELTSAGSTYRPEQISPVSASDHASFISQPNALVIVDFYADWCGPCKMLGPVLDRAAANHPGVVFVGKANVDLVPDLAQAQGVSGIPDVRIYKNGKEVDRFVGFPGEDQVLAKIAEFAADIKPTATPATKTSAEPVIKPFDKDWIPPGMRRQGATTP